MSDLNFVFEIAVMFIVRIGVPLLLLVILGVIIDRWQRKLHAQAEQQKEQRQTV